MKSTVGARSLVLLALSAAFGCGAGPSPGSTEGSGGATTSSGGATASTGGTTASSGGATSSGGSTGSSGGSTVSTGGAQSASGGAGVASGGHVGSGGTGSGGATASSGGSGGPAGGSGAGGAAVGGSATGGVAGSTGSGGAGGARSVKPSAGCSRQSTSVTIANSLIGIPPGYNGKDPVPAVIAFHAAGNDNTSMERTFKPSDLAKKYFMVYPNSSTPSSGWNYSVDKARYLSIFTEFLSQACVDENRIYATGHSSGAQMIAQLLCSGDGDFDAVAPVASSVYCSKWKKGAIPSLVIHGVMDSEREAYGLKDGNGAKDIQTYLTSNMCQMTSTPFDFDRAANQSDSKKS